MLRILVNGAYGRMGQVAVTAIQADPEFTLVGLAGKHDDLGHLIRETKPQVVVDFTVASVAFDIASQIIRARVHPVIGTSGFTPDQIALLQAKCVEQRLGGIIAPNFSIGAVLMMKFAKAAAHYYSHVEIIEMHHPDKADAPSGTAIKTAQMIAEGRPQAPNLNPVHHIIPGSRGANYENIPIHALRLPGVVAAQEVIFGSPGETLSIRAQCIDRTAFMPGIRLACKKVTTLTSLAYGLENVL